MNIKLMLGELRTLNILLASTVLLHPYSTLISFLHPSSLIIFTHHLLSCISITLFWGKMHLYKMYI